MLGLGFALTNFGTKGGVCLVMVFSDHAIDPLNAPTSAVLCWRVSHVIAVLTRQCQKFVNLDGYMAQCILYALRLSSFHFLRHGHSLGLSVTVDHRGQVAPFRALCSLVLRARS